MEPCEVKSDRLLAREGQKTKGMEQLGFLVRGVGREKAFVLSLLPEFAAWKDDEIFRALFAPDKKQQ